MADLDYELIARMLEADDPRTFARAARVEQADTLRAAANREAAGVRTARAQGGGAVLTNPYTGKPRDYRDVNSDPRGVLMVDPAAPVRPALSTPQPDAAELRRLLALIYAAHEDGDPCYADDVYLGRAFKLSDEDEAAIVAALSAQGAAGAGEVER